mmetsp:Transcript_14630/g.46054  ORF Transcript_14630/g.46054 Transcript_14630/m.46054 type:complete len:270 (+) Transcript_14630:1058-1867(+)
MPGPGGHRTECRLPQPEAAGGPALVEPGALHGAQRRERRLCTGGGGTSPALWPALGRTDLCTARLQRRGGTKAAPVRRADAAGPLRPQRHGQGHVPGASRRLAAALGASRGPRAPRERPRGGRGPTGGGDPGRSRRLVAALGALGVARGVVGGCRWPTSVTSGAVSVGCRLRLVGTTCGTVVRPSSGCRGCPSAAGGYPKPAAGKDQVPGAPFHRVATKLSSGQRGFCLGSGDADAGAPLRRGCVGLRELKKRRLCVHVGPFPLWRTHR